MHKKWTSAKPVAGSQVAAAFNNDSSANYRSQLISFMTTFPMVLQTVSALKRIHVQYIQSTFQSPDLQQVFWLKKTQTNKR